MSLNNFEGKKKLVNDLMLVYKNYFCDIENIRLLKFKKGDATEEFILLTWKNGGMSTANNNCNSLSATARNVARMLDGGVYENYDYYSKIMYDFEWEVID